MKTYLQKHDSIKYSDHWSTPKEIYNYYNKKGYYDPCKLKSEELTLLDSLIDCEMFINPPYSDISNWVDYALNNHRYFNKHIVLLIPSRTDTTYFHKLLNYGCELEFIKGRLKFGDFKTGAPFPSVLVHLKGE